MRRVARRFPDHGWAWPDGSLDQLLKAALVEDAAALKLAQEWLARHDIDAAGFREHRLLAAIALRFGKRLSEQPAYPRLAGLQKMLWSRSRFAMREAEPVLRALVEADCPVMLIKGAARIALDAHAQKGRVSHDIDFLVRPQDVGLAFQTICRFGWEPATGSSSHALVDRLPTLRSLNFQKGEFGDLDLHQFAYHAAHSSRIDDEGLWTRAVDAELVGVPVKVPAASDRIAMAVAHGGLDAHTHSDWLVDCDAAIRGNSIDWDALLETVERRSIAVPTAIALTYLGQEVDAPVPMWVLGRLDELVRRTKPWSRLSALLQAKPRGSYGSIVWLARGCAKLVRLRQARPDRVQVGAPSAPVWRGRRRTSVTGTGGPIPALRQALARDGAASALRLTLDCDLPPIRRRIDFELRSGDRVVALLRYRNHLAQKGPCRLEFGGEIPVDAEEALVLDARPTRFLRSRSSPQDLAAFGAIPFSIHLLAWH
ncbi:hypothetical protein EJC49_07115 [Aquibium carbonis]|uniref:Nucleotidyltransferase family protein n=1 Tax=Aquibium carbonis TaxID=2495581 RepID=A0A429Z0F2_9HYPH|nr:nucleotidyltransferase family protein [Aquibium carbonis]RST87206.1 hypothetical protein EJC49_07115 [Aquibium carbonis]